MQVQVRRAGRKNLVSFRSRIEKNSTTNSPREKLLPVEEKSHICRSHVLKQIRLEKLQLNNSDMGEKWPFRTFTNKNRF